jgi:hypothetical protein
VVERFLATVTTGGVQAVRRPIVGAKRIASLRRNFPNLRQRTHSNRSSSTAFSALTFSWLAGSTR